MKMVSIERTRRFAALVAVLGAVAVLAPGCHSSGSPAPVTAAAAGNLQNARGQKPRDAARGGGGGVPDMNDYPAPAGTQLGIKQGGLK